jgi:hypothetical protein
MGITFDHLCQKLATAFRTDVSSLRLSGVPDAQQRGLGRSATLIVSFAMSNQSAYERCIDLVNEMHFESVDQDSSTEIHFGAQYSRRSAGYHRWEIVEVGPETPVQHLSFRVWPNGRREVTAYFWK